MTGGGAQEEVDIEGCEIEGEKAILLISSPLPSHHGLSFTLSECTVRLREMLQVEGV